MAKLRRVRLQAIGESPLTLLREECPLALVIEGCSLTLLLASCASCQQDLQTLLEQSQRSGAMLLVEPGRRDGPDAAPPRDTTINLAAGTDAYGAEDAQPVSPGRYFGDGLEA